MTSSVDNSGECEMPADISIILSKFGINISVFVRDSKTNSVKPKA